MTRGPGYSMASAKTPTPNPKKKAAAKKRAPKRKASKKKAARKSAAAKLPDPAVVRGEVAALLVTGGDTGAAVALVIRRLELAEPAALDLVASAREAMAAAAGADRAESLREAIARARAVYDAAKTAKNSPAALRASVELGKLQGIYEATADTGADAESEAAELRQQLDLVEKHLRPLELGPKGYPVPELARILATRLRKAAA